MIILATLDHIHFLYNLPMCQIASVTLVEPGMACQGQAL